MRTDALEEMIAEDLKAGNHPFFLSSAAGSTVMGAFDDFTKIQEICTKHGIWHHVDGCWAGPLVFNDKYDHLELFKGVENVDSIAINPHKVIGVPQ